MDFRHGSRLRLQEENNSFRKRPPQGRISSLLAAIFVVGFHLLLLSKLTSGHIALPAADASIPLQVSLLSAATQNQSLRFDGPIRFSIRVNAPTKPVEVSEAPEPPPPNVIAITVPANAENIQPRPQSAPAVRELRESDIGPLSKTCGRLFPQLAQYLLVQTDVLLRVHVEEDGRPSETAVLRSSGDELHDNAIGQCVLLQGKYEPERRDGQAIASWQKIQWNHQM
jgi:hypothetical protein